MNNEKAQAQATLIKDAKIDGVVEVSVDCGEVTAIIEADKLVAVATTLRDDHHFEQLIDVCAVDYLHYGVDEWETGGSGFSRGVSATAVGRLSFGDEVPVFDADKPRFAAVYHLLSIKNNRRLRLKAFAEDNEFPVVPSVVDVWSSANWPEREAFDLMGMHFDGHPDLRRLLTDYGFVGHPFRKDFPLIGNVEMRYDPQKKRVIYEPVTIEPRVLVPRVIRHTKRKNEASAAVEDQADNAAGSKS